MKDYIFYFLSGKAEKGQGACVSDAFSKLGYSGGALRALDFYDEGTEQHYQWFGSDKGWLKQVK